MAYNYYSNLKLLTEKAAVAPAATASYAYPKSIPFSMKLTKGGFLGKNDTAIVPVFIKPHDSTNYGYWGNWNKYKVAENQFYYKSGSEYIAYKFVDKASAPLLTESVLGSTAYTPFEVIKYQNSTSSAYPTLRYWKLSWDAINNKIVIKSYSSYTNFLNNASSNTTSMEGYGCFILFSGGGGGGGGADYGWWSSDPGGGGGGGGATALVYIDLFALYKEYSDGFIFIELGKGGSGGSGGSSGTNGTSGGSSTLYCYESMSHEETTEYIYYIRCNGGGYGTWCAWDKSSTGGTGGKVTTHGNAKDYIKLLTSISGGNGGTNESAGGSVTSTTYTIPFTTIWEVPTIAVENSTSQATITTHTIGYSGWATGVMGAGGGCAMSIDSAASQNTKTTGLGGTGGATNSSGNDGTSGGIAILKNTLLSN